MYEAELLLGLPIVLDGIGEVYQPTILEIFTYGLEKYNNLFVPLTLGIDFLNVDVLERQQFKEVYKDLDLFFFTTPNNEKIFKYKDIALLDSLVLLLKFYLRKEDIKVNEEERQIIINGSGIINRDNFNNFIDVIYKITNKEKPIVEPPKVFTSSQQKDVYDKLIAGRQRGLTKDILNLETIINSVVHGAKSFIPYREVVSMTTYQLMNTYNSILKVEQYQNNFQVYLVCGDPKGLDLTHWSQTLKI